MRPSIALQRWVLFWATCGVTFNCAQVSNKIARVVSLVGTQGHTLAIRSHPLLGHLQGGFPFGRPRGWSQSGGGHQPVAVLHQHVSLIAQLGFLARSFPVEPRLRIGLGLVRLVAALLAVEVHRRVARIVGPGPDGVSFF